MIWHWTQFVVSTTRTNPADALCILYGEMVYFTFFVPRKKCCDFLKLLSSPLCMLTVIRPWADHFQNWVCVKGLDVYTAENKYVLFHTVPKEIDIPWYNMKCSGENAEDSCSIIFSTTFHGISRKFWLLFGQPHFTNACKDIVKSLYSLVYYLTGLREAVCYE